MKRGIVPFYYRTAFFWIAAVAVVALSTFVRLWHIADRPGWEWDEVVYTNIGRNVAEHGVIEAKTDYLSQPQIYFYHPPFHFLILGEWFKVFGAGITQARIFSVLCSSVMLVLILLLLRRVLGNVWALVGIAFLAADMWLNFSQRVAWIENSMIPIGVLGLLVYTIAVTQPEHAKRSKVYTLYTLAGIIVGCAAIYKHTGVIFLGAIVIHTILMRRHWLRNLVAVVAGTGVIVAYVVVAAHLFGADFIQSSVIQVSRSTGRQSSDGALTSLQSIVTPLLAQYKIYVATVLCATVAGVMVVYRFAQIVKRHGSTEKIESISVLYAWALAAIVFFAVLQMWFPHYAMLAFIPLFCYLVAEVSRIQSWDRPRTRTMFVVLTCLIVIANAYAFRARYVTVGHDAAIRDVQQFATTHIPANAKVIADETTGTAIPQPYCILWKGKSCVGATYIIEYTSETQQFENDNGQQALVDSGTLVYETKGFKETIRIYKLPRPVKP